MKPSEQWLKFANMMRTRAQEAEANVRRLEGNPNQLYAALVESSKAVTFSAIALDASALAVELLKEER